MNDFLKIIVINYHLITDSATINSNKLNSPFNVKLPAFLKQMNLIKKLNIPVISLNNLTKCNSNGKFAVVITFDDGNFSDFKIAFPLLKNLNFTASFFPVVNKIGTARKISWDQLAEISDENFSVGSHGLSHCLMTMLTGNQQQFELQYSKALIEERINKTVAHFSLPYGLYNKSILKLAEKAGYKTVLTTNFKINYPHENPYVIHRWNIKQNTPLEKFEKLLITKGYISPLKAFTVSTKEFTKKVFERPISIYINRKIYSKMK